MCLIRRARDHRGPRAGGAVAGHETTDSVESLGGDAAPVAKPAGELAVVDRAPAEGGLGQARLPAIIGNLLQQFLRVHGGDPRVSPRVPRMRLFARLLRAGPGRMRPISRAAVNHKSAHYIVGIIYGLSPTAISRSKSVEFLVSRETRAKRFYANGSFVGSVLHRS